MGDQFIAAAERWLERRTDLAAGERAAMARLAPGLIGQLPERRPAVIGLSGAPGTGKTTLAGMLCAALNDQGRGAMVLSLDDYYLPAAYRRALAQEIHPLFAVRGVPGTHDLDLLLAHIDAITAGAISVFLPRFDKANDDRLEAAETMRVPAPLHCLFIEGWCIGAPPQPARELAQEVNELESLEDRDREWRKAVNVQVQRYREQLSARMDQFWLLEAPDWDCVVDWRWRQEQHLEPEQRLLESPSQVMEFLANYERLCRHMLATAPEWANVRIELSPGHRPGQIHRS